ncbi:MAG TPA: glycoside hydrolase family 5 protein [Candidatus Acidoferrum sp.]|nr:glycoside hydrolase family 5 protein [Candidatus Acidoferrum sp.]
MKLSRENIGRQLALVALPFFFCLPAAAEQNVRPPLHTDGHRIVDAHNRTVKLASVNWYGFDQEEFVAGGLDHQPLKEIVNKIAEMGFNSVRLPWANETFEKNPVVADYAVKANPQFRGKHAMDVMDAVIAALAKAHLMVILDNHMSRADWCCSEKDGNGLWANAEYSEERWLADWKSIVQRYRNQPYVVGADLRNELRSGAQWGGTDPALDWHAAAERGGNAVLEANPKLLIMVEGPQYSTDFRGAAEKPVVLKIPGRLVYSPHAYASQAVKFQSYEEMKQALDARAGFLLAQEPGVPLWVGEFGTCQTLTNCGPDGTPNGQWFIWFVQYLKEKNLSWCYWPLNGNQSSGESRKYDTVETYGLLSADYKTIAAPEILRLLRTIEN